ncbi:hypothetical protein BU24DRAFT_468220 [Aaosphaeria arxii CBS 175.79]|uniref:Uncharacterized protein n=1 Tax=Aaosphaeria arxii CBS 175.79 TaxID=1450172 RepID=A0A6A5X8K2_9PLEO|nr:uncharacterized protein BU24DRAFT_468220 [Aaosphaeria arxii CBS 175.79]KAF2009241.1 hypothetical protein BU24DRAFT_468220 [Aaosphaeria arxii CBS 175.79]
MSTAKAKENGSLVIFQARLKIRLINPLGSELSLRFFFAPSDVQMTQTNHRYAMFLDRTGRTGQFNSLPFFCTNPNRLLGTLRVNLNRLLQTPKATSDAPALLQTTTPGNITRSVLVVAQTTNASSNAGIFGSQNDESRNLWKKAAVVSAAVLGSLLLLSLLSLLLLGSLLHRSHRRHRKPTVVVGDRDPANEKAIGQDQGELTRNPTILPVPLDGRSTRRPSDTMNTIPESERPRDDAAPLPQSRHGSVFPAPAPGIRRATTHQPSLNDDIGPLTPTAPRRADTLPPATEAAQRKRSVPPGMVEQGQGSAIEDDRGAEAAGQRPTTPPPRVATAPLSRATTAKLPSAPVAE